MGPIPEGIAAAWSPREQSGEAWGIGFSGKPRGESGNSPEPIPRFADHKTGLAQLESVLLRDAGHFPKSL